MSSTFRERSVAVAVIYDQPSGAFLLWNNRRWHGYAFPMKHFDSLAIEAPAEVALQALAAPDFPLSFPDAAASPLDRVGHCLFSEGVHQYTFYDYYVFAIDVKERIPTTALDPDLRLFQYDELVAAPHVTPSTRMIAESFVQDRHVALAVVARWTARGLEFLLTRSKQGDLFFPATRVKADTNPAHAVLDTVHLDLAYQGEVEVVDQAEVSVVQESSRFGRGQRRFHFQLCLLRLPAEDLTGPDNDLERSLNGLQAALLAHEPPVTTTPYWNWLTEDEIRKRPGVSAAAEAVLLTAVQLAERKR